MELKCGEEAEQVAAVQLLIELYGIEIYHYFVEEDILLSFNRTIWN